MTEIKQYRKKPVVIRAWGPLTPENKDKIAEWCKGIAEEKQLAGPGRGMHLGIIIRTLEGDMKASYGDYVIQGVKGEFYACKPDIFAETYEEVRGFLDD